LASRDARRGFWAEILTLGYTFPLSVLVGWGLGHLLDQSCGTRPWGVAGGLLLGFAAALVSLFRLEARWRRRDRGDGASENDD